MRVANNSITIEHIANKYLETHDNLTKKEVKTIMYMFNKLLSEWLIDKGYKYKLPHNLGYLCVAKREMKYERLHLDYKAYKETGQKVYHLNEHSDGWYSSLHWEKKSCKVINKTWYSFKLTRGNQRRIASIMKQEKGHQIYKEWN